MRSVCVQVISMSQTLRLQVALKEHFNCKEIEERLSLRWQIRSSTNRKVGGSILVCSGPHVTVFLSKILNPDLPPDAFISTISHQMGINNAFSNTLSFRLSGI